MIWNAIAAVCAAISILGAAIAWWRSNYSRTAKNDAEDARDYSRRMLEALETTATSVQKLSTNGDTTMARTEPFTLTYLRGSLYRLQNNTDADAIVEQIDNADRFVRLDLQTGTTIPARDAVEFLIAGAWGMPVPGELVLGLAREDHPTRIPIPAKP